MITNATAHTLQDDRPDSLAGLRCQRPCRWRLSLVQQLVLLVLGFSSLAVLVVLSVMTSRYLTDTAELTLRNTRAIAQHTALAAAQPMRQKNRRALNALTQTALAQPGIQVVQIRLSDGEILAQAGKTEPASKSGQEIVLPIFHEASHLPLGEVMVRSDDETLQQVRRDLWWTCGLLFAGGLLAVGLAGWWVAQRVSAPLRELAEAVDQLAQGEAAQVEGRGTAEIGRLQRGFNRTAQALARQRSELEERVRQATNELECSNARLQMANQAKSRMLAAASHDLRQPLHALNLFTDALQNGETDPVRMERVARVRECVDALDRLFTGLLDLAQLDAGTVQPCMRPFALDTLFDELSRNFRALAEQQELRLVVRKTDLWVHSDYVMLLRVLNNLVSNALRYTCAGGVLVAARRRGQQVRIDVVDSGVGIAQAHQYRVFEEFYQVDPAQARAERGLGLGLATVQRLAHLLEIPVRLQSRLGHGTMLSLEVPGCSRPVPQAQALVSGWPVQAQAEVTRDVANDDVQGLLTGLSVLVIDDEVAIREGLELVLLQGGATVATAQNRAEALEHCQHHMPDVVLCDLLLGAGDNGLDVLAALRRLPQWQARPPGVLLVTGETSAARLREIASAGVRVLHKPAPPWLLRRCIAEVVACVLPSQ